MNSINDNAVSLARLWKSLCGRVNELAYLPPVGNPWDLTLQHRQDALIILWRARNPRSRETPPSAVTNPANAEPWFERELREHARHLCPTGVEILPAEASTAARGGYGSARQGTSNRAPRFGG